MSETVRLFIGCSAGDDQESCAVAEASARRHCSLPIEIVWMYQQKKGFWSGWNTAKWRTPFTGFRWGIPAFCQYQGRAIYTDSDFIFRGDLAELWNDPALEGRTILLRRRDGKIPLGCILFDCAKFKKVEPGIELLRLEHDQQGPMKAYFMEHRDLVGEFSTGDWEAGDVGYKDINDPRIKAIHYTRIETQPHLEHAVERLHAAGRKHWYTGELRRHERTDLIDLFNEELRLAFAEGHTLDNYDFHGPIFRHDFQYKHHKGTPLNAR